MAGEPENMDIVSGQFYLGHTTNTNGDKTFTLSTQNKFVDKNIGIKIYTPNAGNLSFEATNNTAIDVTVNTPPIDGKYQLAAAIGGTVTPASAGWISASTYNVQDNSVIVGRIAQSSFTGTTVTPAGNQQTVTIAPGYYHENRQVIIKSADTGTQADVTSGAATLGNLSFNYNSTSGKFDMSSTATIAAPTVSTAGYISSGSDTLHTSSNVVSGTVDKVGIGVTVSGGASKTPSISKQDFTISGVTNAASGTATTVAPSSGVYVKVKSGATNSTVSSQATVTTAGYGTTEYFNADSASITTVTINASPDTYIPITTGAYSATVHTHKVDAPVVNRTIGGTITNIGQTTKPSGTDGTNYWTISPTGTTTAGTSTAAGKANITTAGYILTGNTTSANSTVAINPTINDSGTRYILKGTITNNTSGGTSAGTINRGKQIKIGAGYYTANVYYTAEDNSGTYNVTNSGTHTVDGYKYASVGAASFTNHTVSGQNYTDISSDNDAAPVLISGDYLYINAGYTSAKKISLARLVPDSIGTNTTFATSNKMLANYVGFNADGVGVVGTIGTYDGTYSIT